MSNIRLEIQNDLQNAKKSIKVAVSWLTDVLLINELIAARRRGVDVKVVVSCNELNIIRFELFQDLINLGGVVNKEGSADAANGKFMHFKLYIIDDKVAKAGSYNWSANAPTNRETLNVVPLESILSLFNTCFAASIDFFADLPDPTRKKAELNSIEREYIDVLTPEKLAAYRQTQALLSEQKIRHEKELVEMETRIRLEEKAKQEKIEAEKTLAAIREKESSRYGIKADAPAVSEAPPTSYANEK